MYEETSYLEKAIYVVLSVVQYIGVLYPSSE